MILFLLFLVLFIFISAKQLIWLYKIYGPNNGIRDTIIFYLNSKGIKAKSIEKLKGKAKKENPLKRDLYFSIPLIFGPTEITRYMHVIGEDEKSDPIQVWVRITFVMFGSTKYKYSIREKLI